MRTVRILAWIVIAIMAANMANVILNSGMGHGAGFDTFLAGADDPWQLFINNDLVTGLLFTTGWIIFRERGGRRMAVVAWVWMVLWWGNIVVAAYVLRAAAQAGGDWPLFFLGRRAGPVPDSPLPGSARLVSALAAIITLLWTAWGVRAAGFAPIATFGYVMGFAPIILSLVLIALPARQARTA